MSLTFAPGAGLGPVTLVSCLNGRVDAFVVGLDGAVLTSSSSSEGVWTAWRRLGSLQVAPCAPVTAVSRAQGLIEVFAVCREGNVHCAVVFVTALAAPSILTDWFCPDTSFRTVLHAKISVTGTSDSLYLHVVGHDGYLYEQPWTQQYGWMNWFRISTFRAPPGAPLGAALTGATLNLFVVGNDHILRWRRWTPSPWDFWAGPDAGWSSSSFAPQLTPRTPITAIVHPSGFLCVFFPVGTLAFVIWQSGTGWMASVYSDLVLASQTPITAARSLLAPGLGWLDILAVGQDGGVYHAVPPVGTPSGSAGWRLTRSDFKSEGGVAVGAVSRANGLLDIAAPGTDGAVRATSTTMQTGTFGAWVPIVGAVTGMADPQVGLWSRVAEIWPSVNGTSWTDEAQGMTTDGLNWYLSSNGTHGLRKYDSSFGDSTRATPLIAPNLIIYTPGYTSDGVTVPVAVVIGHHVGAPDVYADWVYVPLQDEGGNVGYGIWRVRADLREDHLGLLNVQYLGQISGVDSYVLDESMTGAHLALSAVNPLNGRLYSPNRDASQFLAFDKESLTRCPVDDIVLGRPASSNYRGAQGAVFTRGGRLIVVNSFQVYTSTLDSNSDGWLYCFSAITGRPLTMAGNSLHLGDFGHRGQAEGSETEGVTVRDYGGGFVHITEIDNRDPYNDNAFLHTFSVSRGDIL